MKTSTTANVKNRKSSDKHLTAKCPECDKEMSTAHMARHMRRAHKEEVKASVALPKIAVNINDD